MGDAWDDEGHLVRRRFAGAYNDFPDGCIVVEHVWAELEGDNPVCSKCGKFHDDSGAISILIAQGFNNPVGDMPGDADMVAQLLVDPASALVVAEHIRKAALWVMERYEAPEPVDRAISRQNKEH